MECEMVLCVERKKCRFSKPGDAILLEVELWIFSGYSLNAYTTKMSMIFV